VASEVTLQRIVLLKPIQHWKMNIHATDVAVEDITFRNAVRHITQMDIRFNVIHKAKKLIPEDLPEQQYQKFGQPFYI